MTQKPRGEYEMVMDGILKSSTHTTQDKLFAATALVVELLLDLRDKLDENHK